MSITGTLEDGKIVLPPGVAWPNGAKVRIELLEERKPSDQKPSVWDVLKKYEGIVDDMPADLAKNHDKYARGHAPE
jgi:hypothetical protein